MVSSSASTASLISAQSRGRQRPLRVAIVGAGLGGTIMAIELKKAGVESFDIYERADDTGGTWRDNTYPGCACDVKAAWYSLSSEPNPNWSQAFAGQAEIKAYWDGLVAKYRLRSHINFNTTLVAARWSEETSTYTLELQRTSTAGDDEPETFTAECDVLVSAIGGFSTPVFAESLGEAKAASPFKGPSFHSARWDHSVDLTGKRVGIIGQGCSACQIIPTISKAGPIENGKGIEVVNFIRTPAWFLKRDNPKYSAVRRFLFRWLPFYLWFHRISIMMFNDSAWYFWLLKNEKARKKVLEKTSLDYLYATAPKEYHEALTPKYPVGCKRIVYDAGYLSSLNRPNVRLVTDPIAKVVGDGVILKSGEKVELDVLVYATGFDTGNGGTTIQVYGADGKSLAEHWDGLGGPQALYGCTISNFPNYASLVGPNTASGHASLIFAEEVQVGHIMSLIKPLIDPSSPVRSFRPSIGAMDKYNEGLQERLNKTVWTTCKSWYRGPSGVGRITTTFPGMVSELWWRARKAKLHEYELRDEKGRQRTAGWFSWAVKSE